ncbi:hypothetical protein ABT288_12280 [Streptomyces sp. NPDC001093]|uniref:terpene synthase family protein n=1 Tax=Streptomyces sp. NPDC001093 TaxID=3154376 RepID=UPI00331A2A37
MPQDLRFDLPFAAHANPQLAPAVPRHLQWLRSFGLLPAADAEAQYLDWEFPALSGFWWPHATGAELDLALDAFAWMVLFDGQFDTALGMDAGRTRAAVDDMIAALRAPEASTAAAAPAAAAFRDLWNRERDGMTRPWHARATQNWQRCFEAFAAEAANRCGRRIPTPTAYDRIRDAAGYMPVLLDLSERVYRCEIPAAVHETAVFRTLRKATVRGCNYIEDLFSLHKEEVQGDPHNIVLVLEHHHRLTRPQAIDKAIGLVHFWTDTFLDAESKVPAMLERLNAPAEVRGNVHRIVGNMRDNFAAAYTWTRTSPRYTNPATRREDQPGYLGDILTPRHLTT